MMGKWLGVLLLLWCCVSAIAQDSLRLSFVPVLEAETKNGTHPALEITVLKAYLNSFQLYRKGKMVWEEGGSHFLIDAETPKSRNLSFAIPKRLKYDEIQFVLGVDSTIQAAGVQGGDLDPLKGMYWTWNTGYIHFKLEGTSPQSEERNQAFHYHLGGYQAPYSTLQTIRLKIPKKKVLEINMNPHSFLEAINIKEQPKLMSVGEAAQKLSYPAAQIFSVNE